MSGNVSVYEKEKHDQKTTKNHTKFLNKFWNEFVVPTFANPVTGPVQNSGSFIMSIFLLNVYTNLEENI